MTWGTDKPAIEKATTICTCQLGTDARFSGSRADGKSPKGAVVYNRQQKVNK